MTVLEAQEKKAKLTEDITMLIQQFENEVGLPVHQILVTREIDNLTAMYGEYRVESVLGDVVVDVGLC